MGSLAAETALASLPIRVLEKPLIERNRAVIDRAKELCTISSVKDL